MAEVSVKQLATDIDTPVDRLLQQFVAAGIEKSAADDMVSESEKQTLLAHLKKQHGGDVTPARMTLQRKTKSTLSVQGAGGKNKSVQVEVRKSRTYVRRTAADEEARLAEEQAQKEAEEAALREAQEQARVAAEAKAAADKVAAEKAAAEAELKAKEKARKAAATVNISDAEK